MLIAGRAIGRVTLNSLGALLIFSSILCHAQSSQAPSLVKPEKIVIDTDIGDDIDDAFAVALAIRSPELQILGISTTFGDTETRAKLLDRLLDLGGACELRDAVSRDPRHVSAGRRRRRRQARRAVSPGVRQHGDAG